MESRESIFNELVNAYKYALYCAMLGRGETEGVYLKAAGEAEQYRKRWGNASCYEPQGQTCKVCGHRDKFNFNIPDEIWNAVVPEEYRNRVVCLTCFDNFAHHKKVSYAHSISSLYFAGNQASYEFKPVRALDRSQFAPMPHDQ